MNDFLKTQLQVPFDDSAEGVTVPVSIELDQALYPDLNVHLLGYPPSAVFSTDVGRIVAGGTKEILVPPGIITLSGGRSASLPKKPVSVGPSLRVLFSYDLKGQVVPLSLQYNATRNQIDVSVAAHAAIAYSGYKAHARMLTYEPLIEPFVGGGTNTTYGIVVGFHPPKGGFASFQIPLSSTDSGDLEFEVYRRVSYGITTPEGEFEMPPQYPNSGAYTTPANPLVLDVSTSMRSERVHEIGMMNLKGYAWVRNFFVPVREPYIGDAFYRDVVLPSRIEYKKAQLPTHDKQGNEISKSIAEKAANFIASKGYG